MATLLHLPFNQESSFLLQPVDVSVRNWPVTVGGAAALSSVQSKFGGRSLRIDGSSTANFLQLPASSLWAVGANFTIQTWIYIVSRPAVGARIFCIGGGAAGWNNSNGIHILLNTTPTGVDFQWWSGSASAALVAPVPLITWTHIALCGNSTSVRAYINGVLTGSGVIAVSPSVTSPVATVGSIYGEVINALYSPSVYLDDLRVDDTALYTADFTPPSAHSYSFSLNAVSASPASILSAWSLPAPKAVFSSGLNGSKNIYHGGPGSVIGTVKRKGTPANVPLVRRVRLLRDRDGVMVGETWSNSAGAYVFRYLDAVETYTALSYDHTGELESVCASGLKATVAV